MNEFDKEEREELVQIAMEKLSFSKPAAEIYVDCAGLILDAAERFQDIGEYLSAYNKECTRKTLINLLVGWLYVIDINENAELMADTLAAAIEVIKEEAK